MHPILNSLFESLQINNDSRDFLSAIQEIRETLPVSLVVRPGVFGDLQLLRPLEQLFSDSRPGQRIDLILSSSFLDENQDFLISRYLRQTVDAYNILVAHSASAGFLLLPGAKELVLSSRAGFLPYTRPAREGELGLHRVRTVRKHLGDEALWHRFKVEELADTVSRLDSQMECLKHCWKNSDLPAEKLKEARSLYLEAPFGPNGEILREDLQQLGFEVLKAEQSGVLGSLKQLEVFYTALVRMATKMEGMQQVPRALETSHPSNTQQSQFTEVPFEAQADLIAIVESPLRRFLCFEVQGLPQTQGNERLWVEK